MTPPSRRLETISLNKEFHLPVSRLVFHSHWKVFFPNLIVCWPVPSRLKHTFGELFVKVIIGGQWCIHSPGLQSACPRPVTLSDPGTCTRGGWHTLYKTDRELNTDTLSGSHTQYKVKHTQKQTDTYTYSLILMHMADWWSEAISHQARISVTLYKFISWCLMEDYTPM